jgi:hypothetical protein
MKKTVLLVIKNYLFDFKKYLKKVETIFNLKDICSMFVLIIYIFWRF